MKTIFLSTGLVFMLCACSNQSSSNGSVDAGASAHTHKLYNSEHLEVKLQMGNVTTSDIIEWSAGPIDGYGTRFNSSVTECRSAQPDESGVVVFRKTSCK